MDAGSSLNERLTFKHGRLTDAKAIEGCMTRLRMACYIDHTRRDTRCSMPVVMSHPFVTCGHCGQIHECVRLVGEPCSFTMLCHGCEGMLTVTITAEQIAARRGTDLADQHFDVSGAVMRTTSRWAEEHGVS